MLKSNNGLLVILLSGFSYPQETTSPPAPPKAYTTPGPGLHLASSSPQFLEGNSPARGLVDRARLRDDGLTEGRTLLFLHGMARMGDWSASARAVLQLVTSGLYRQLRY